jgi:hypothetical protein
VALLHLPRNFAKFLHLTHGQLKFGMLSIIFVVSRSLITRYFVVHGLPGRFAGKWDIGSKIACRKKNLRARGKPPQAGIMHDLGPMKSITCDRRAARKS